MKRLLCLTPNPVEGACDRHRVYEFLPYLQRAGFETTVRPMATPTLYRALQARGRIATKAAHTSFCGLRRLWDLTSMHRYDMVMINREVFPFFTPVMETLVFWRQPRVVFSFDDAIYEGHEDVSQLTHPWLYRLKHSAGVKQVIGRSAHVIAGSNHLAAYARQYNNNVSVVPTVVDLDQYTYLPRKPKAGTAINIGWWGSRSTSPYLSVVNGAFKKLVAMHGDRVQFTIWGDGEYRSDVPNTRIVPFSLAAELEELGKVDIGVMPMPDTRWTRGKCAFKAIQYMARGIPAVVSPVGMSAELVEDGVNGLWAGNEQEWVSALDRLIRDQALRERFSIAGRRTVEQNYSLQVWGPRLAALLDHIIEEPCAVAAPRTVSASS